MVTLQVWEMKRIAKKEVERYRDSAAFVRGYLDGGGAGDSDRYAQRQRWVWAIDRVRELVRKSDPDKSAFFERYWRFDAPHTRRNEQETIVRLSLELYVSPSTLYQWRDDLLLSVAIAAVQAKALRPF